MKRRIKSKYFMEHLFFKGYKRFLFFWIPVTGWEADEDTVKHKLNNRKKKVKKPASLVCIAILLITIIFIFTRSKHYDYDNINSIEYNRAYNEKYPIIDTIEPYYKNANRIFIRKGFNIGGHEGIGTLNGGSQMLFICNPDCKECNKK